MVWVHDTMGGKNSQTKTRVVCRAELGYTEPVLSPGREHRTVLFSRQRLYRARGLLHLYTLSDQSGDRAWKGNLC